MMVAAAARKQLSLIGLNLWQTGIRSLFKYLQFRAGLTQDEAWAAIRADLESRVSDCEEWEFQQIRAILYEELNVTLEMGQDMYAKWPDSTPLIDAMRACLNKAESKIDG